MKKRSPFTEILKNERITKDSYLFNIEHSRISDEIMFLTFEVFNYNQKSIFKLKIQVDITEDLKSLPVGKSSSKVGLVSLSSKNFLELMKDGIGNAIGDGRIPFLS